MQSEREVGEPSRIRARQILVQLLSNACRFTPEGGRITVSCAGVRGPVGPDRLRGSGPWVRIDVEDDGIGIPPERLEAVFEPFVQGDNARYVRQIDGSGLRRHPGLREALKVLERLFEQAERISLQGWHYSGEGGAIERDGAEEMWLGDGPPA